MRVWLAILHSKGIHINKNKLITFESYVSSSSCDTLVFITTFLFVDDEGGVCCDADFCDGASLHISSNATSCDGSGY